MNKKLRIAQIFRAPMGGLFRHVRDLTTELDNRGHEIALICAVPPNDFEKQRLFRGANKEFYDWTYRSAGNH